MEANAIAGKSVHIEDDESGASQSTGDPQDHSTTAEFPEISSDDDLDLDTSLEDFTTGFADIRQREILAGTPNPVSDVDREIATVPPSNTDDSLNEHEEGIAESSLGPKGAVHRDASSTSFHESIDEIVTTNDATTSRFSKTSEQTHENSGNYPRLSSDPGPANSNKAEQILGAHLLAHEITLQALMRDEDVIDRSLYSIAAANGGALRASLLPPSLRLQKARGPASQTTSVSQRSSKKVHVIPPPVDTSGPRHSLPIDFLPTPYPFDLNQTDNENAPSERPCPSNRAPGPSSNQRILLLRIRGPNPTDPNSRSTTLLIPPSNHFSIIRASHAGRAAVSHPTPSFFDDEDFLQQLRASCKQLSGPFRPFSARSLRRIIAMTQISSSGPRTAHTLPSPLPLSLPIPILPGARILSTEVELLLRLRKPSSGRAKYHFVRWAYHLAGPGASPDLIGSMVGERRSGGSERLESGWQQGEFDARDGGEKKEEEETGHGVALASLDLVVDWSVRRVAFALGLVIMLSVAAALLWVFLGTQTSAAWPPGGGFRGAGDRVGSGMMLGIAVLLVGLSLFAGWLGVSWLVM